MLFARGLQLVSRPCIFTALDLHEVYFLLANIELFNSAHFTIGVFWVQHGANEEW